MAMSVQTSNPELLPYRVPSNLLQASKALTLKREIDILCASKATEILRLANQYPLEPATYCFNAPGFSTENDKTKDQEAKKGIQATPLSKHTDVLSINLERVVPDYAHYANHMYIPMEVLGVERQHYYKAIKAADFLHYPEAVDFYANKAVLDIEQQFLKLVKKTASLATSERGFMIFESHPIFSNERYAQLMLEGLQTLEFDVVDCPFHYVAKKIRSPIVLWEMQRRSLNAVSRHLCFEEFRKEWDEIWNFYYRRNRYILDEIPDESAPKASDYWQKFFIDRYFDKKLDNYTARISIPNLALLLAAGDLLSKLNLNVAHISTLELSRLFSRCSNIASLTMTNYSAADIGALVNLPNLRKLVLKTSDASSYWEKEQIPLYLEGLVIEDCEFEDAGFMTMFPQANNLRHLSLINCSNLTDSGLKAILKECRNLKSFRLSVCPRIDGTGLSTLCVNIESLHLENLRLKNDILEFFLKSHLASLRELNIANLQGIKENTLGQLWLQPPINLAILRIDGAPQISGSKLKKILSKLNKLTHLTIGKNEWINDQFVKYFQEKIKPTMPLLAQFDFKTCPNVTFKI